MGLVGAQLRITDVDGHRITAFATNTPTGGPSTQLPDLELRHRRRARAEDRIRATKDTGLTNLPLHDFTQTRSGAPSSRSPSNSPPGCKCSPSSDTTRVAGNPNACGYGCSASPPDSHSTAGDVICTSRRTHPGQRCWPQ